MKISQLEKINLKIKRDAEFETLGYLNQSKAKMLVYLDDERFLTEIKNKDVAAVITTHLLSLQIPANLGLIISSDPFQTFLKLHCFLMDQDKRKVEKFISPKARIDPRAVVAEDVFIGEDSIIEANVVIYSKTHIGNRVIIRAGAVIGSEGFEYKKKGSRIISIPHAGAVRIEDEVEVKSNTTVDRGLLMGDLTTIGAQTKIDKGVQISHNVRIGKRCLIIAGAVINGSCTIGDEVYIGPNAVVSNRLRIDSGAFISLGAVVVDNVKKNQKVSGHFATSHDRFLAFLIKNRLI